MLMLMSEFRAKWGDTPDPYDPNINRHLLYSFFFFNNSYEHYFGVIGMVVWLDTEVDTTSPSFFLQFFKNYYSRFTL